jgi:hypothetical protein
MLFWSAVLRVALRLTRFALRNGTFGCYEKNVVCWKNKYKEPVVGICAVFNDHETNMNSLIVGFRDGRIESRHCTKGRASPC